MPPVGVQKPKGGNQGSLPPPYGSRKGWVPRTPSDFADGGAFPEIPLQQYPGRGIKSSASSAGSSQTLALSLKLDTATGSNVPDFSAVARQGLSATKLAVYTDPSSMKEKWSAQEDLARPETDVDDINTNRTANALSALLAKKMGAKGSSISTTLALASGQGLAAAGSEPGAAGGVKPKSEFVRYTPSEDAPGYNPKAAERVIKIVTKQQDPLEPPKFKHKKVPRGPGTPPPPRHHSPPRKLTAEDQAAWAIPPCVSNWKNSKGYIIPLDKRIAADGRQLLAGAQQTLNDRHAELAESLYHAEGKAREELRIRQNLAAQRKVEEAEQAERDLKEAARKARDMAIKVRRGEGCSEGNSDSNNFNLNVSSAAATTTRRRQDLSEEDEISRKYREEILAENRREVERQFRLERAGGKNKLKQDKERDISEKVALGQMTAASGQQKLEGDALYDSRLLNRSAGMDSGFGADDTYNVYEKPLFTGSGANQAGSANLHTFDAARMEEVSRGLKTGAEVREGALGDKYGVTVEFERDEESGFEPETKRIKR